MQRLLSFVLVIFLSGASHADMAYENVKLTVSDDQRLMLKTHHKPGEISPLIASCWMRLVRQRV